MSPEASGALPATTAFFLGCSCSVAAWLDCEQPIFCCIVCMRLVYCSQRLTIEVEGLCFMTEGSSDANAKCKDENGSGDDGILILV